MSEQDMFHQDVSILFSKKPCSEDIVPFSLIRLVNIYWVYADDTTLMAEGEEELKNILMKVKEESEKVGLIRKSTDHHPRVSAMYWTR